MTKAYSYIRFSTPEQEKGDSLRRQTEYSEQVAAKLGLTLDDSLRLTDRGLSAYKGDHRTRGALGGFLKLVDGGSIQPGSVLIIEALDRLSREGMLETVHLMTGILIKGIDLYTAMDDKHFSRQTYDLADLIISATKLQQGHEESEKKSLRLGAAWKEKRTQASNGHKLTAQCPAWLRLSKDRKSFTVLPEVAQVVNWIFRMKLEGKGSRQIERLLNTEKGIWVPPPKGNGRKFSGGWRTSYINKILNSRAVIGEFIPHRKVGGKRIPEDPIPGYYPTIIEPAIFYQVQALIRQNLETNGFAGGQNGNVSNLFGHLAKCPHCGGPMAYVGKGKPPRGGSYLVCDRARRGLGCEKTYIRYDRLEPLILSYCRGLDPADILPNNGKAQGELATLKNRLQSLEGELAQVQGSIEKLLDNLELGEAVRDRLQARQQQKTDLEAQREDLSRQIARLSASGEETERQLLSIRELIGHMAGLEGQERTDLRLNLRGQLRRLLDEVQVWPDRVGLHFKTGEWRGLTLAKDGRVLVMDGRREWKRIPMFFKA